MGEAQRAPAPMPARKEDVDRERHAGRSLPTGSANIRGISDIQDISGLIRLPRLLGARSGKLHNQAELSRSVGMPASTQSRYIPLPEALFLVWLAKGSRQKQERRP